jgi:hypothetical protein
VGRGEAVRGHAGYVYVYNTLLQFARYERGLSEQRG